MLAGLIGSALAPAIGLAMLTFAVTGAGNALFVTGDRVLLQRLIPDRLHGRAFGLVDSIEAPRAHDDEPRSRLRAVRRQAATSASLARR